MRTRITTPWETMRLGDPQRFAALGLFLLAALVPALGASDLDVEGNLTIEGFKPWIDVTAYGADPADDDGDDTAAIQQAINQAQDSSANGGTGTVYIPAGTYRISETLAITNITPANAPLNLIGDSQGLTILRYTGSGNAIEIKPAEQGKPVRHFILRNLTLNAQSGTDADAGIYLEDAHSGMLENVWVSGKGFTVAGIHFGPNTWTNQLHRVTVTGTKGRGIYLDGGAINGVVIRDSHLAQNLLVGLHIRSANGVRVSGTIIEGNGPGNDDAADDDIGIFIGPGPSGSSSLKSSKARGVSISESYFEQTDGALLMEDVTSGVDTATGIVENLSFNSNFVRLDGEHGIISRHEEGGHATMTAVGNHFSNLSGAAVYAASDDDLLFVLGIGESSYSTDSVTTFELVDGNDSPSHSATIQRERLTLSKVLRLGAMESGPADPQAGDLYYNEDGALCFYDGTDWHVAAGSGTCE